MEAGLPSQVNEIREITQAMEQASNVVPLHNIVSRMRALEDSMKDLAERAEIDLNKSAVAPAADLEPGTALKEVPEESRVGAKVTDGSITGVVTISGAQWITIELEDGATKKIR